MTPSTAGSRTAPADVRASDAERDAVAEELARHHQEGRLDAAEFDERVGRAVAARTQGDLDTLLADLPPRPADPPPARRGGSRLLPLAALAFIAFAVGLGAAAHAGHHPPYGGPGRWAFWWLWWVIPVAILTARRWLRGRRPFAGR